MMMRIRKNCAEGRFFPDNELEVRKLFKQELEREKRQIRYELASNTIVGGIVPHAGHIFCAREAIHFFEIASQNSVRYDTIVVVNPNHTGLGAAMSVDSADAWQTSLGTINVDVEMARVLKLPFDTEAQKFEHSAEVILPYIQYYFGNNVKILPINILSQSHNNAVRLAEGLRDAAVVLARNILIVASSDFCHFKSPEEGFMLDNLALEPLLEFDLLKFERIVKEFDISICGFAPIMVLLRYAQLTHKNPVAEVLCRGHSGEVHPSKSVVDYVSMLVYSE